VNGVVLRLGIVALLWGSAACRLALLGWPWALSGERGSSALAVGLGLVLGAAQGWFIAVRAGGRIRRWSREAVQSRKMDALLVGRGLAVIVVFAGLGLSLKHFLLAGHPVLVGGVYVLASTSLFIASVGLVRLAWLERSDQGASSTTLSPIDSDKPVQRQSS